MTTFLGFIRWGIDKDFEKIHTESMETPNSNYPPYPPAPSGTVVSQNVENPSSTPDSKILPILKTVLLPAIILIAIILLYINSQTSVITVIGEGRAGVTPEIVRFTLSIAGSGATAEEAFNNGKNRVREVKDTLARSGVTESDITSSTVSVTRGVTTVGYRAGTVMQVSSRQPDTAESLLIQLLSSSLDVRLISPVSYTTEDPIVLENQARAAAIADAREKAKAIAKQFGKRLGSMVSFADVSPVQAGTTLTSTAIDEETGLASNQAEVLRQVQVSFRSY